MLKCDACGGKIKIDLTKVLTSLPVKYEGKCTGCGKVFYLESSEIHVGDIEPIGIDGTSSQEAEMQKIKDMIGENRTTYSNYGWICPKCGSVMSPDQKCCPFCSPSMKLEITY